MYSGKQLTSSRWRLAVILAAAFASTAWPPRVFAANGSWNTNAGGNWNTASNWTPNTAFPGTSAGDVVGLVNGITSARTVTINTAVTLGTLNIGNSSAAFTLTDTTGGSLTFNNSGSGASIVQQAASAANLISAGFTLADSLTVTNNQVSNGASPINALTLSGNISESGGARALTKTGVGSVVLSGSNTYSGKTTASAGILQFVNPSSLYGGTTANWTAANITSSSGATLAVSVGVSNFTAGDVTTLLANVGATGGSVASGQGLQAGSSIGFDTSTAGGSFTVADAVTNSTGAGGGSLGLVKLGSGTLTLSGLSSTAANNYTGTTIIDQGTLVLANGTKLSGGLTFGNGVGTTNVGTLDLPNSSVEIGGTTLVRNTGTNTVSIGAGQSLISRGNVQIGDGTGLGAGNPSQALTVQGSGTWNVAASNGTFRVGNASSARGVFATFDASQLNTLSVDLRTTGSTGGTFTLNENVNGGGNAVARLAVNTTIKANTVSVASTGGGGTNQLLLGTGAQVIHANNLTIGSSARATDIVQFQDAVNGTLTLRSANGTGRASVSIRQIANTSNSATLNLAGHAADLLMSTVALFDFSSGAGGSPNTATFTFDSGTFDATTVIVGRKTNGGSGAGTYTAILNLGGTNNLANTVTVGSNLFLATQSGSQGTVIGRVNIAGTQTAATIANATLASTSASGGIASGTLAISGGSTTITNGITLVDRSGTPGTANATLSITGGSLSVGGNIATNGSGGTITSTVTLDGGSLNLNGFALGAASQLITSLNLRSGTLSNVGGINNGAGLVKTSAGRLTLAGNNTFAGNTDVQAGEIFVTGSVAGNVQLAATTLLGGAGSVGGTLSGSGLVSPGNSPGILTAAQFDPSGGLDAAFEFTSLTPNYSSPTGSLNDVLRLTDAGAPFASGTFSAGNVIDVYFNIDSITSGQVYEGGFFTELAAQSLLTALDGKATFAYWGKTSGAGTRTFDGVAYVDLLTIPGVTGVTMQAAAVTKDFGGSIGNVSGSVTQFVIVPEPSTVIVAGIGIVVAGWSLRKRRRLDS